MHDKLVALVTGANKGIGLQIAKELAGRGFTVLVGSRNLELGEAAAKSVGSGVAVVPRMIQRRSALLTHCAPSPGQRTFQG
jgi:NAD(P)-dependent dehydrogenase (short-subunit alcohol dehydrogenase family)